MYNYQKGTEHAHSLLWHKLSLCFVAPSIQMSWPQIYFVESEHVEQIAISIGKLTFLAYFGPNCHGNLHKTKKLIFQTQNLAHTIIHTYQEVLNVSQVKRLIVKQWMTQLSVLGSKVICYCFKNMIFKK